MEDFKRCGTCIGWTNVVGIGKLKGTCDCKVSQYYQKFRVEGAVACDQHAKYIKMIPVTSSNILEIGHDPESKELHVKFMHSKGEVYVYQDITTEIFEQMKESPSVGKFLNSEIKGKHIFDKRE